KGIELQPDFADPYVNLGEILLDQKRFEEAEAACRKVIELEPDIPNSYGVLGLIFLDQKKLDQAEAAFRKVTALQPDLTDAYLDLAKVLAERKDHAGLARTALDLSRSVPKGWAECHQATSFFARCVMLAKQDTNLSEDERMAKVRKYEAAAKDMLR